ncbi:vacuolar protein sorting-associated protein 8 homolog [Pyxicephalus adspersus]|uniref:vacuolar protein sorting-associated protein 8 homolog n=1 Tax=Pyxicephalus adspersus TaxID=30357 RepID=UPI003B5C49BE
MHSYGGFSSFSSPIKVLGPGQMESDPGEDDPISKGWDSGKSTSDNTGSLGNLADEINKSRLGYLDVDKELEAKQDLIDDKEFDIPQVDTPPTLESILNEKKLPDAFSRHGAVLRHTLLKGVSAQILSAADKVDAGLPTAISTDANQALRLCLGSTAVGAQYGAVSALSINNDCSRLLCGFAKGQITMWDLASGKLLRSITDAHPPGTAILHIKFTDDPTLAICNDSGGSVFELTFKMPCLQNYHYFAGEVCCIEPLHTKVELRDHPIAQYSLLAMASLTKILVIGLKPSLKVWMTFPYGRMDPSSVPLLAWHFVILQGALNPMLAFCRGDVVHFLLVKRDESGAIHINKQKQLHLHYDLINFTWINARTVALLDSAEKLHVIDRQTQEELETQEISDFQLVYNSSHFKSLATGGNVSQALALVGEKACYQSISSYGGQIFYLGTKSVHAMMLRNWRERVDHLLKQDCYNEALALAWSFHEGKAKAVVGLSGDPKKRKSVVADKIVEILLQYTDKALRKCPEQGKIQVMEQHFQDTVPVLVDYCLLLQRTDILFSQMFDKLCENCVARGVFLECLEPYLLRDQLPGLTTHVMKDLLLHFQDRGMMESLEACIVHMDITSLDIQQIVQMCWEHRLYDAMIYVYNSGTNDFISPMEKLFKSISAPIGSGKSLTDEQVVMGNKLLVYISSSLAGRAYPLGDIPEDLVPQVKNQVFEFLIRLHSPEAPSDEEVYPYIRTLLHFDTREFLNVLALTFEDFTNDKQAVEHQQRIVDILLKVMVENSDFTPSQVGCLFTFLARQLAKPDNTLFVNRMLFDQVLEFLCSPDDDSRHSERQQVLLELLQAGGVVQFEENRLIQLAERAQFYQICEFMYERKHLYDKIIDCYLQDPIRKQEIFNYIHNILSIPGYSSEEKQSTWDKAMKHMEELVTLCPSKAADLVCTHFDEQLSEVLEKLQDSLLLFQFLRSLLDPRDGMQLNPEQLQNQPHITELFIDLMCQYDPSHVTSMLQILEHYRLEETIQIAQKHNNHETLAYLLEKKGDIQAAFKVMLTRLQERLSALTTVIVDGGAFSTEGIKESSILKEVKETLSETISLCERTSRTLNQQQREALWFPLLEAMMSSQKLLSSSSSQLYLNALKSLTMDVLNSMAAYISLPSILQRILQVQASWGLLHSLKSHYNLSLTKKVVKQGHDNNNKEAYTLKNKPAINSELIKATLLETTTSLLNQDLHWSLRNLKASITKALAPKQDHCCICLQQYKKRQEGTDEILVFSCGHLYHSLCLTGKDCKVEAGGQSHWICYRCHSSSKGQASRQSVAEMRRGRTASLVQVRSASAHSSKEETARKSSSDSVLDPQQLQAFNELCRLYKGTSRLALLTELCRSQSPEKSLSYHPSYGGVASNSVFQNENFQLHLAPPPIIDD